MEYRNCPKTGDKISALGLGGSYLASSGEQAGIRMLRTAFARGINYFDLASTSAESFPLFGKAFREVRDAQ